MPGTIPITIPTRTRTGTATGTGTATLTTAGVIGAPTGTGTAGCPGGVMTRTSGTDIRTGAGAFTYPWDSDSAGAIGHRTGMPRGRYGTPGPATGTVQDAATAGEATTPTIPCTQRPTTGWHTPIPITVPATGTPTADRPCTATRNPPATATPTTGEAPGRRPPQRWLAVDPRPGTPCAPRIARRRGSGRPRLAGPPVPPARRGSRLQTEPERPAAPGPVRLPGGPALVPV